MKTIERAIDINVPASKSYNAWMRFEQFPEFMQGVEEVRQVDERRLRWRAKLWGKTEQWDAEITEQIPDKRIAWRSTSGAENSGVVTFHRLSDDSCRVMLQMAYQPAGLSEKVGDVLGILERRITGDLERFKTFVETQEVEGAQRSRQEIPAKPDADQQRA